MNNDSKYIELRYETGWKHPVQAYSILKRKNKPDIVTHFFAEWNTFEEAINFLTYAHKCPIIIKNQTKIGLELI